LFSDRSTRFLWQIRHFPNQMKIFAILTAAALAAVGLLFAVPQVSPLRAMLLAAQDKAGGKTSKQPKTETRPAKSKTSRSSDEEESRQQTAQYAASVLQNCRANLRDDKTYQADIDEQVHIGGRAFSAKGKYWKGTGLRSRLELNMVIGEGKDAMKAHLLQVCDGEVLMTEQVMGKKKLFTRRNVKQILAAAAGASPVPRNELVSEFGLGGMNGLIASLQRTMVFDSRTSIPTKGKLAVQIEGTWNNEYMTHWVNWSRQTGLKGFPAHVPERVRVLVDSDFYVRKIEYLHRGADGKSFVPLVSLSFRNIQLNRKLDDQKLFQYVSEPGVYVDDTTARYIQMFQPRPAEKN
jgi:hypothetical protein